MYYSNVDLFSMYNLYEDNAIHQKCSLFSRITFNGRLLLQGTYIPLSDGSAMHESFTYLWS